MRSFSTKDCTLTVAPSLIDMGFAFFDIWLLMLKPILETLQGAAGLPEDWASSSDMRCWEVRLTAAVPSPPTVLQETGLVFTLPSSSCGPAWGKTTHQGEQQLSDRGKIRAIYLLRLETFHYLVRNAKGKWVQCETWQCDDHALPKLNTIYMYDLLYTEI